MKLLLDEQLPRKIALEFPEGIIADTVQSPGWSGIENGELLRRAASRSYAALISADKNMPYQQAHQVLPISVVVLHVVRLRIEEIVPLLPRALQALENTSGPAFIQIHA